jgi:hypothetical protein
MRSWLILGIAAWSIGTVALGEDGASGDASVPAQGAERPAQPTNPPPGAGAEQEKNRPSGSPAALQEALERMTRQLQAVTAELEQQRKRSEIQQKQLEVLQQQTRLLAEQVRQPARETAAVEQLQTRTAALTSRAQQAAVRDQELAKATDELREKIDAEIRSGPRLPAPLKELFLPSYTNETPLSVYFLQSSRYLDFVRRRGPGQLEFEEFSPFWLLQINKRFLLEAETVMTPGGFELGQGQMDMIVNDWLTGVVGHFLAPIGFFNERLHPQWINKLPDFPVMMQQAQLSDLSINGFQFRGAKYLGPSSVKPEYSLFIANGLGLPEKTNLTSLANLDNIKETSKGLNDAMAYGGRLGLWLPRWRLNGGLSGYLNRPFTPDGGININLWAFDANYHRGNWDFRLEYASMIEQTRPFIGTNIGRRGLYAQIAYRNYNARNKHLSRLEGVFRYSFANFSGINPRQLDLAAFDSPLSVPVNRNQYTLGINYYFYPSIILKIAYEINQEQGINLKDNVFMTQMAFGF